MLVRITAEHHEPDVIGWDDFAAVNVDGIDSEELADIRATLERGEEYMIGGGAAPLFTLTAI